MIPRTLPLTLLGLLMLGACRNPSPEVVFHTLSPIAPEMEGPATTGKPLVLEVMPVQLPELLQRSQIVLLDGQDSHRLASTHRWGNTLEKDMQRVVIENLASILGNGTVVPYPSGEQVEAAYRISLDVQQCEGAPGGTLRFRATWMVTRPGTGRMILLRRVSLLESVGGGSIGDLVSAHSRVLATLSREIAKGLDDLR